MIIRRSLGILFLGMSLLAVAWPAAAETRIEKDLPLQAGGQFVLDSDAGSVTVSGAARSGAHIVITSDRDDLNSEMEFGFTSSAGVAQVTGRRKNPLSWGWSHGLNLHFEVEVPTDTRADLRTGGGSITLSGLHGASDVKTSGGSITVNGLNGNLEAHTSGGSIRIREVTGDAHVDTSGGPIDVEALDGNLQAHTSGGGIHIERVSGYVVAKTSGGPIKATYSAGNRHGGEMDTSGGGIEVAIDPSANLNIDATTSGGTVSSDLPVRTVVTGTVNHSSLHGSIGSGGEELRLHTSGGSIHIRAL